MKNFYCCLFLFSCLISSAQQEEIRLKAQLKIGKYGYTGSAPILTYKKKSETSSWRKLDFQLSGVESSDGEWFRENLWFQTYQWVYQNYKAGKMNQAKFSDLMESWQFDTVKGQYTSEQIESSGVMLFRQAEDEGGEFMVDVNLDHDFSNEKKYRAHKEVTFSKVDSLINLVPWVQYELYLNGKVLRDSVPILVESRYREPIGHYMGYSYPVYAETVLGTDTLIVNTSKVDFQRISVSTLRELRSGDVYHSGAKHKRGSRVNYSGVWYTIEYFDRASLELVLSKVDMATDTISANVGFVAPDFQFTEMLTDEGMSLKSLRGRYVLLDFWGTWCGPCVMGIPELVELKKELKDEPFEILSVACSSSMDSFEKLNTEHGMDWLHMWNSRDSGLEVNYNVQSYPTYILIDPKGKVVSRTNFIPEVLKIINDDK